jgi:sigma-B regulation protein RsbU (phosphoserine phosphatase)
MTQQSSASILVVDDVAENRDLLVRRLRRLGIESIEEAVNGVEALAAIERTRFDLVLLDIMMPEMNGYQVLEHLKRTHVIQDLPVIVISALSEIEPVVRCIELGAEDFVFKPFNPTLLRARVMATLEKKMLRDATNRELKRKQLELNEARTLQLALKPPPLEKTVGEYILHVDSILEPAKEVGGDLVDHFCIDDDLLVLILGDVSDKGAGAALMMARTHALLRSLAARPDAHAMFSAPEIAAGFVNATLAQGNLSWMFVTLFVAVLDLKTGSLRYVRAGHVPPFLRRSTGTIERLEQDGGMPLGILEDAKYESAVIAMSRGDELLAITDGISEAFDPSGNLFGEEWVGDLLINRDRGEAPVLDHLLSMVRAFAADGPQSDDIGAIFLRLG